MANAFGGEATSPGWFNGADVNMKEYRPVFLQYEESSFRSHSSPMGIPKSERKYWWRTDKPVSKKNPRMVNLEIMAYPDPQYRLQNHPA